MARLMRDDDEVLFVHNALSVALEPRLGIDISDKNRALFTGMRAMACWMFGHESASTGLQMVVSMVVEQIGERVGMTNDETIEWLLSITDEGNPLDDFNVDDLDPSEL